MACEQKHAVVDQWEISIRDYADAVWRVRNIVPELAKEDWLLASEQAARARTRCEELLATLRQHSAEHHC
jgi:hypothetical protein